MGVLLVFLIGLLISIFELSFVYAVSPKEFELKIVDNIPNVTIHAAYFFLPFTTKIRNYKGLEEAYIRSRTKRTKYSTYEVHDLVLKFSKKSVTLFEGWREKEDLLEYCKEINKALKSFEECYINKPSTMSNKKAIFILFLVTPLFVFIPYKHSDSYISDITQNFYIYLATTGILAIFVILSLIVNLFINTTNSKKDTLIVDYNKKEKIDLDSEAAKINNSIIK